MSFQILFLWQKHNRDMPSSIPTNTHTIPYQTELLVKRAGVKMDGSKHSEAETLFSQALSINPTASDALLHRANLRMLQQRVSDSENDLETCIRLYPNNLLARLRLATVYMAKEDMDGAKRMLDQAEEYDPDSSEVRCYRGELHFARGDFAEAKLEFEKAMECDPYNPTPYVNAALAVVNTPPAGGGMIPDFGEAIRLLEKAIQIDPMFHAAYVQLGQMKLSMATDLKKAREVVELYDRGLEYCRTPEELKDICCMRILTVAQIDAAHALHMETLNMQWEINHNTILGDVISIDIHIAFLSSFSGWWIKNDRSPRRFDAVKIVWSFYLPVRGMSLEVDKNVLTNSNTWINSSSERVSVQVIESSKLHTQSSIFFCKQSTVCIPI